MGAYFLRGVIVPATRLLDVELYQFWKEQILEFFHRPTRMDRLSSIQSEDKFLDHNNPNSVFLSSAQNNILVNGILTGIKGILDSKNENTSVTSVDSTLRISKTPIKKSGKNKIQAKWMKIN